MGIFNGFIYVLNAYFKFLGGQPTEKQFYTYFK